MTPFLETAIKAAEAAQIVINKYYAGDFEIEIKPDETPVTIADVETEKTIKKIILDAFLIMDFLVRRQERLMKMRIIIG